MDGAVWTEYEFPAKPGDVSARPPAITPWHYRLTWLLWFAGFGNPSQHPWLVKLCLMLLRGDSAASSLLASDPFNRDGEGPPTFVRADLYLYEFAPRGSGSRRWWRRERVRGYLPPLSLRDAPEVARFLRARGLSA